jgi:hypothetical protein
MLHLFKVSADGILADASLDCKHFRPFAHQPAMPGPGALPGAQAAPATGGRLP